MRHLAIAFTSVIALTALSVPAHAADQGAIHFLTDDDSVTLSGGSATFCLITDADNAIAEFDVDGTFVSINLRDGRGGIAVEGKHSFEGIIEDAEVNVDEQTISLSGNSDNDVEFILNAACTDAR